MGEGSSVRFTFSKSERLCSGKEIQKLFETGKSFLVHPFKIVWIRSENSYPNHFQVLISVSKRNFKKAVTRNLIKRRIREAFRKNKYQLVDFLSNQNLNLSFAIIYIAKDIEDYTHLQNKIIVSLKRLTEVVVNDEPSARNPEGIQQT